MEDNDDDFLPSINLQGAVRTEPLTEFEIFEFEEEIIERTPQG